MIRFLVAVGVVLMFLLFVGGSSIYHYISSGMPNTTTGWIILLAVIVLAGSLLVYVFRRTTPVAPARPTTRLVSTRTLVIGTVLLALLVLVVWYRDTVALWMPAGLSQHFKLSSDRWWTIAVPAALMLAVLIWAIASKLTLLARAGVAVACWIMIALLWVALVLPVTNSIIAQANKPVTAYTPPPRTEWGLAVAPTSPCDSREQPYVFEARKPAKPFNFGGQCGPALWHKGHCVWVQGYKSSTAVRRCDPVVLCTQKEPCDEIPLGIEYAWSAEGYAFEDKIRLDPRRDTAILTITR